MKPQLILLGAPGSGKGSQAKKLVSEFGYNHVSTGDLLRAEIAKESPLGLKVKAVMDAGDLVNDKMVLDLLAANCDLTESSYIFDGFPRNIDQVKSLDEVILKGAPAVAIYFEMDTDILVERIVNRRTAPKSGMIYNLLTNPPKVEGKCDVSGEDLVHRKDDNEETVRNRMSVFEAAIAPILDFYSTKGILKKVNASSSLDEVFLQLKEIIKS